MTLEEFQKAKPELTKILANILMQHPEVLKSIVNGELRHCENCGSIDGSGCGQCPTELQQNKYIIAGSQATVEAHNL